jgi:ATP-binding cassette, subfamily B, bacterial CvaB/MchF/RaxB
LKSVLAFLRPHRLPILLQTEMAECGLASLAMLAVYHGHNIDLNGLRQRFALSLKGATLAHLISIAGSLQLACRPLRLELEQLDRLALPCILHWDLSHFVVLKVVDRSGVVIHDPAFGARRMTTQQVSAHFSGVALEVAPTGDFRPQKLRVSARLSDLWSRVLGWKRALVQTVLLSVLLQFFAIAAPSYLQLVIDEAVGSSDTQFLTVLAGAFVSMFVVQAGTQALRSWVILQIGQAMNLQLVGNVLRHLLRLPASFFEKRMVGDILSRMGSIRPIQEALTQSVVTALIDGVMAIGVAILLFVYSPVICAVVLGCVLTYFAVVLGLYPLRRYKEEELLAANAESQTYLIESIRAAKTVKLFGREALREAVWRNYFVNVVNASMGIGRLEIAGQSARTLIFGVQVVAVVYLSALMVMRSEFTLGMLFAVMLYRDTFTSRAEALAQRVVEFRLLKLHLERLADIVQATAEPGLAVLHAEGAPVSGRLELRSVSFRYADNEPFVLQDVSLDVLPGQFVAIVGASGGGKSTLLKVMLGLLPPSAGEVCVEGQSLQSFGVQNWRRSIGVVQQDDSLLMGTIADNISFFDADLNMTRVIESANAASVHDEIVAMPMGYMSLVGDMGSTLSGGQRQRVLLARALYVRPKILFLDEGTANLDPRAEVHVAELVEAMPITRVVVAHRPELIARAHRVFELRGGRLHERVASNEDALSSPEGAAGEGHSATVHELRR